MQISLFALHIERAAKIGRDGGPLYETCDNCGAYPEEGLLRCKGCMNARYCNRHCQKEHWVEYPKGPCKAGTAAKSELPSQLAFNAAYNDIRARESSFGDTGFAESAVLQGLVQEWDKARMDLGLSPLGTEAPSLMDGLRVTLRKKMLMEKMEKELESMDPRLRESIEELQLMFHVGMIAMQKMPPRWA